MAEEGFGQYLRSQRELRQISLEEVAAGTKIGIHLLKALEEERWESLPADVFVKGFIKSYAEYIGLDPEDTLLRYEAIKQKEVPIKDQEQEFNIPRGYSGPLGLESPLFFKLLILIILIILIGFGIYFFSTSSFNIFSNHNLQKAKHNNTIHEKGLNTTTLPLNINLKRSNIKNNTTNNFINIPNSSNSSSHKGTTP